MSCRVALPVVGGSAESTYWPSIPFVAVLLAAGVLPLAAAASQLMLALAEVSALSVLLWPVVAVAIRRLRDRRTHGWLCLPCYLACIVVLMAACFGKPVSLGDSTVAQMLPLVMLLFLTAWLIVDSLTIEDPAVAEPAHGALAA